MPTGELQRMPMQSNGYLDGQLLLAMPSLTDPRFSRAVIYMCAHSAEGAMGIIVNQRASNITFPKLLEQLDLMPTTKRNSIALPLEKMAVHSGGPVEQGRGFVLHSADYFAADSTLPIDDSVSLTATIDILRAIASGSGPMRALLALGYAGWRAGQLENEINANGWLTCPADPELVFDCNLESKYERAMAKLGVHPSFLVSEAGHA
jgi:putative transcriptional regulator